MGNILCAIRAGEGSRAVQRAAIHTAKESNAKLIFLHVIDQRNNAVDEEFLQSVLLSELHWMGKTLLRIAGQRAQRAGLADVELVIREGNLPEELRRAISDRNITRLFIGAPRSGQTNLPDRVNEFILWLIGSIDVAVEVVSFEPKDA